MKGEKGVKKEFMRKKEFEKIKDLIYSENQNKEQDFKEYLSNKLVELQTLLKNDSDVVKSVTKLKEILDLEYNGLHSKAFDLFCKLMNELPDNTFEIERDTDFYRIRKCEFSERKKIDLKEMFHIPFTKRGIVKTQRYSISGLPCLYLSRSVYGCWEEMGRPHLDECMVSRFQNRKELIVFDIRIPIDYKDYKTKSKDFFKLFPLIASCMVPVKNQNDFYKPEYIIPQMLMEWILTHNEKNRSKSIVGVYYTSVLVEKDNEIVEQFTEQHLHNVAIPAIYSIKDEKYSSALCKLFCLTKPICREFEAAKGRYRTIADFECDIYESSDYGFLEKRLKDAEDPEGKTKKQQLYSIKTSGSNRIIKKIVL